MGVWRKTKVLPSGGTIVLQKVFDFRNVTTPMFFDDTWAKFQLTNSLFFSVPTFIYYILLSVFIIVTVVMRCVIQSQLPTKKEKESERRSIILFQALYVFLCPPLFSDWELIHRESKCSISFEDSWKKSQMCMLFHIGLHFVKHAMLCVPLFLLKGAIDERNDNLKEIFPPLGDEMHSTQMVNVILGIAIGITFVLPALQFTL
jgi:hypothetical protein